MSGIRIGTTFSMHRFELIYMNPSGEVAVDVTASDDESSDRSRSSDSLDIVRDDVRHHQRLRTNPYEPGDEAVTIPALGFNIGATLDAPEKVADRARLPQSCCFAGAVSATAAPCPCPGRPDAGAVAREQ